MIFKLSVLEKFKSRNNELMKIMVQRMSKQINKIPVDKFAKYKFEIISIISYLQDISQ